MSVPDNPAGPVEPSPQLEADLRRALSRAGDRLPDPPAAGLPSHPAPADSTPLVGATPTFDGFYAAHRATIYRALSLALADRDLTTEAVDRGFSETYRHWRKRRGDAPTVFRQSRTWALGHAGKSAGTKGFRLDRHTPVDAEAVAAFGRLEESDRSTLVVAHLLGWDGEQAARALDTPEAEVAMRLDAAHERLAAELGTDAGTAARRLALALPAEAAAQTVPLSRLEFAKGKAWTRRLVAAGASAAAVLVLIGGVGLGWKAFGGSEEAPGTAGGTGTAVTTPIAAPPVDGVTTDLEWARIPIGPEQGDVSAVAYGPAGFVVMGQAYDNRGSRLFAYVSADGEVWEPTELPEVGLNGGWINQVIGGEFGYAALGQTYDERAGTDTSLVWISPDGVTWTPQALPIEQEGEVAGITVRWYTYASAIVKTADGFMVFGNQGGDIGDPERFLRDVLPDDVSLFNGWGFSGDRFDVYGNNGQVVFSATFEELGLDPEIGALLGGGKQIAWRMDAEGVWTQLDLSDWLGPNNYLGRVVATPAGLVAVVQQQFGAQLWFSKDGSEWERASLERGATIRDAGAIGDTFVAIGSVPGSGAAWTSPDGVTWEKASDPALSAAYFQQVSSGTSGMAAIASGQNVGQADLPPATVTQGGMTVTVDSSGFVTVIDDATGAVLAEWYGDEVTYGSNGSLSVPDPDSDEPLIVISAADMNRAWEQVYATSVPIEEPFPGNEQFRLLLTTDGISWSTVELTESIGPGFYPSYAAVGPDLIILTGWQESFGGDGGSRPSVWVGRKAGS